MVYLALFILVSLPFAFSSLPIQATIIFYKVGLFYCCIEQLGQTVSCGIIFLVLQLKEFFYSFHSITDCMIGSIFYFTTGLHGAHVFLGLLYFYLILCLYCVFDIYSSSFYSNVSMIYSSFLYSNVSMIYNTVFFYLIVAMIYNPVFFY